MKTWPDWDLEFFRIFNGQWHTSLLDRMMPLFTSSLFLAPAGLLLLAGLALRLGRPGRRAALAALLALALSDLITAQVVKPAVHRPRPCRAESDVRLLVRCGGRNGFPSNHAANAGAVTVALGVLIPGTLPLTLPLALGVAWSRVYVGVHYPLDVLAGLLLGGCVGCLVAVAFSRVGAASPPDAEGGAAAATTRHGPIAESEDLR